MALRPLWCTVCFVLASQVARTQTIRGTLVDSASGKGVAGARVTVSGTALSTTTDSLGRFVISGAPNGEQTLTIRTPSLDSLNAGYTAAVSVAGDTTSVAVRVPSALQIAATACGGRRYGSGGILLGRLKIGDSQTGSLAGMVSAEWKTSAADPNRWVSAAADARGRFALCGVPLDTALSLRAATDDASGQATEVRVTSAARFGRIELALHRELATTATFVGVVTDSVNTPVANADVTLLDAGKGTATNEQGAFALRDVPAGAQHVVVRHVGYAPVESQLTFAAGQTLQRHVTMTRTVTLDSVVVTEKSIDHQLDDFDENRKLGLGHFLTRADLAPQEGRSTAAVLTTLPGIKVFTIGPYAWVGSGRHVTTSIKGGGVSLDDMDVPKRAPLWDCYALVYVDDHLVFRGQKFRTIKGIQWEPLFDINSIPVADIEAIEYYASAAQVPLKYAELNSECGVVVIHTLRYHPKDTTATPIKRTRR